MAANRPPLTTLQGLRVLLVDDHMSRGVVEAQLRQPELQYAGKTPREQRAEGAIAPPRGEPLPQPSPTQFLPSSLQ